MERLIDRIYPMPLNLQYFAEGGNSDRVQGQGSLELQGSGTQAGRTGSADGSPDVQTMGDEGGKGTTAEPKPADLNALLKGDKALQSQFDKLVSKALDTAKTKWQQEQSMTAEQLAAAKLKEQEDGLSQREQELAKRERRASALGTLGEKGLPVSLIDCIALDSDDTMKETLEKAEKAFRASVDAAVKDKLKGGAPKDNSGGGDAYKAQMRAALGLK